MFEAKKETPSLRSVRPQGRFGFGQETAHDLGHRQDFLDSARGLPGSKQSLVRPAGLVRRQYLAPQAIAVAACFLAFPAPFIEKWRGQRAQNRAEADGAGLMSLRTSILMECSELA
jgi:hypothetical protein